jgi:hypothetical protein
MQPPVIASNFRVALKDDIDQGFIKKRFQLHRVLCRLGLYPKSTDYNLTVLVEGNTHPFR